MAEARFRIIFEHLDEYTREQDESHERVIQDAIVQSREIRELAEIINRIKAPTYKPLLYSGT